VQAFHSVTKRTGKPRRGRVRTLDRAVIAKLRDDGFRPKEIAAKLGCGRTSILRILSELNQTEDGGASNWAARTRCMDQDAKFCAAMQAAIDRGLEHPI
jgi:DNA invertase Pin-like site-specific DNA recombinase